MGNSAYVKISPVIVLNMDDEMPVVVTQNKKFVLGIIDVQNDFINGSLKVTNAEMTIGPINKLRFMMYPYMDTFISLDYHPDNHMSFADTHNSTNEIENLRLLMEDGTYIDVKQNMWPKHCVKNTLGAQLHSDLIATKTDFVVKKGTKANVESYSAFGDEFQGKWEKTPLESWLKSKNATDIILTGIATDYCVYNTALDAIRLGFKVHLIMSCTKGVAEGTTRDACHDMVMKGVLFYSDVNAFYEANREFIV